MHELDAEENAARVAKARLFCLRTRREIHLLPTEFDMPETPDNKPGSNRSAEAVAKSIEQQLRQIDAMADQHYPEDESMRNAYRVTLLQQRLREMTVMFVKLEVRS